MSLFGALSSGVSGLSAQSSAMGAVSDNITNVNTIGYKNTQVNFQTLVTAQVSTTSYSPGGVQSRPRQDTGVQGLLQSTNSQTDIAISGQGYFIVNELSRPTTTDGAYLFTRAGSFFQDNEGFLRNTSGFYLQGWPVDASGNVTPANDNLTVANQNVLSPDFLTTVNLSRVGGTATSTSTVSIGANLPANGTTGEEHKTDVQVFDSLGNATTVAIEYSKFATDNQWGITIEPPSGTEVITQFDDESPDPRVYQSIGQLQFGSNLPQNNSIVTVESVDYVFRDGTAGSPTAQGSEYVFSARFTLGDTFVINGTVYEATAGGAVTVAGATAVDTTGNTTILDDITDLQTALNASGDYDTNAVALRDFNGDGTNDTLFLQENDGGSFGHMDITMTNAAPSERFIVDISAAGITQATVVSNFVTAVRGYDPTFDSTNGRIAVSEGSSTTVLFKDDGSQAISVDPTAFVDANGNSVSTQTSAFTVQKQDAVFTTADQFRFNPTTLPADGDTITLNGITYEFESGGGVAGTNTPVAIGTGGTTVYNNLDTTIDNLVAAVIATDNAFNSSNIFVRDSRGGGTTDTLVIRSLDNATTQPTITFDTGFTAGALPTDAGGTTAYTIGTAHTIQTLAGVVFDSDGLPSEFNTNTVQIEGFANGAADMDGDTENGNSEAITLDLGTVGEADGLTQFGAAFTPGFIQQNGSRFGVFAGVTISQDGLMTALFDNGETRPIFKLPITTFTNVNELETRTGNVWNATEASGDPTLREADSGPAGLIVQAALEQSTVDIGTEFTDMIVIQRAYSAAAKIITTADEMLEELIRVR